LPSAALVRRIIVSRQLSELETTAWIDAESRLDGQNWKLDQQLITAMFVMHASIQLHWSNQVQAAVNSAVNYRHIDRPDAPTTLVVDVTSTHTIRYMQWP